MPRSELGPWGKLYASLEEDTAHYSDRQFRALVGIVCRAIRGRGELPKLRPLQALYGSDEVGFLVDEGRLVAFGDGKVEVVGWATYQAPIDRTNVQRQRAFRERQKAVIHGGDNGAEPLRNGVTVTDAATSTSTSLDSDDEPTKNVATASGYPIPDSDRDALDRYFELTGNRPWDRNVGAWLRELQAAHGDVNVAAALEVEFREKPEQRTLVGRVQARLERQADRVRQAKAKEPPKVDPLQAQIRAAMEERYGGQAEPQIDTSPEAITAAKAALAELRSAPIRANRLATNGAGGANRLANGAIARVGDLLGSGQGGSAAGEQPGTSLTADESSDRESAAARGRKSPTEGSATPSPVSKEMRGSRRSAEPGDAEPDRPAAPSVGA
jgi:hypothetical protein